MAVIVCCGVMFGDDDEKDKVSAISTSAPASTSAAPQQLASLAPSPSPTRTASPKPSPSVYYADCDAVADAGLYRITKGSPGYRKALDRNGDGIACNLKDDPDYVDDSSGGDSSDVYYANCSEARAAGAAPLHRGDPGYSRKLDRDGDGTACE
ncbi:excalibur calcium-binding domain-containing protein [Micromonospora coxensis]|uniref:excalibur calcium-binding domain-containing protein n=1 Tax=Micromonospora coxensis TaxID=356852 RepID=UPI001E5D2171|nr:excalibur calcium-binding domain-containing protein [Micromonospora coxensis]